MRIETISKKFTILEWTPVCSWCWIRKDAAEIRDVLRAGPPGAVSGPDVLWQTQKKTVLRLKTASGLDLACKWGVSVRWLPYGFSWTQAMKEAYNFKRLAHVGLPLVKLVAVGEERGFFSIRNYFLVTEYADGFLDGRYFFESMSHETEMRDEFTRGNFILIARLHDAGFCHGGFTPMNELWRKLPEPDAEGNRLDIRWIDIATCSRAWGQKLKRLIAEDLVNFLRFYSFTEAERREICAFIWRRRRSSGSIWIRCAGLWRRSLSTGSAGKRKRSPERRKRTRRNPEVASGGRSMPGLHFSRLFSGDEIA